ncbi:MAG: hypothetical protein J6M60_01375 [Clostridia bacterium]|nr:hypothetical protein [Clostridia bacterium]
MYYGKKKGLIILIALIVFILLLAGGCFGFMFFTTDIFKSNDELFFKYLGKSIEDFEFTENLQMSSVSKLKQQQPYTVDGTVVFSAEGENINKAFVNLNNAKIEYNAKVDPIEEKSYAKADLKSKENSIFSLEFANSNNIYALKSDDIVTAFIGIENKDLNVLTEKLGMQEINISDEIYTQNYENLFKLSELEKQHLLEYYSKILKDNIPSTAFTKESNITNKKDSVTYNTTGYRLNLTYDQLKRLEVELLKALKQDSISMNILTTKAKAIGLGTEFTEVNMLSSKIDQFILQLENSNYVGNDISIIVYVADGDVISTELIEKNKAKYTVTCTKTDTGVTRNLLVENFDVDGNFNNIKINLIENNTPTQSFADLSITVDDEKTIRVGLTNEGSATQGILNSSFEVTYEEATKAVYSLEVKQKLEFVDEITDIIELSRNNCGVLNDYTSEQILELTKSIMDRIGIVAKEKMDLLGVNFVDDNSVNPVLNDVIKEQEKEAFNAKFSSYEGKISGTSLKTLSTVVQKNNENEQNKKVVLLVEEINVAGDNKSIDTNKTYNVGFKYTDEGYIKEIVAFEDNNKLIEYLQQGM